MDPVIRICYNENAGLALNADLRRLLLTWVSKNVNLFRLTFEVRCRTCVWCGAPSCSDRAWNETRSYSDLCWTRFTQTRVWTLHATWDARSAF